nr:DNA polymerase III subunit epsilon [bacterium]
MLMSANIIRVIDLETTGFEPPKHKVVEIAAVDFDMGSGEVTRNEQSYLVDPQIPIPPESSAIHHITDDDIQGAPFWDYVAPDVLQDNNVIAFAAHNAKFEKQWCTDDLTGRKPWICTYKCALRLWRDAPAHSNQGLRYWKKPVGLIREKANLSHRALPDAYVTAFHLRDLLAEASFDDLVQWSSEPALQVRCYIGKFRGMLWSEVDLGFLYWVSERDFDEDVLFTVNHEIQRRANYQSNHLVQ